MRVSVVLPTYNEAENIVPLVEKILENIPYPYEPEIIVVDDSSPDGTYNIVKKAYAEDNRVRPLLRKEDRGLAKSIGYGLEQSTGDRVIVMDTDFTHDPAEIPRLLHVAEVFDVVTGSRFCPGGNMPGLGHYLASMVFNWNLRLLLRTQIQDNLSGMFCANRKAIEKLDYTKIFFGYGDYFFRFLHFVQLNGCSLVEIPVIYQTRMAGESKSNFLKLLFKYSYAAIKLKFDVTRDRKNAKRR